MRRLLFLAVAISVAIATPVLADGEHESQVPTATAWGASVHGLALGLTVKATTIHMGDALPTTIQVLNRTGKKIYAARTIPSLDYNFKVVDSRGVAVPPSKNVPFDNVVTAVTGQGDGIYPGEALIVDFANLVGYIEFPGPGIYTLKVSTKLRYLATGSPQTIELESNAITINVMR